LASKISPLYMFNMSKKRFQTIFITFLSLGFIGLQSLSTFAQVQLIQPEIEEKVNELLQQMTLEEKIGQLNLHNGSWDVTVLYQRVNINKRAIISLKMGV